MKDSTSILFKLLRAALGNESVGELSSDFDWQEVIDLSFDQGVAAIAVDGLQKSLELKAESLELAFDSPELEDLKYEWFGSVFTEEQNYSDISSRVEALARNFNGKAHQGVGD